MFSPEIKSVSVWTVFIQDTCASVGFNLCVDYLDLSFIIGTALISNTLCDTQPKLTIV